MRDPMSDPLLAIGELCFRVDQAGSTAEVRDCLQGAAPAFGARYFMFGMRSGTSMPKPTQLTLSNYPKPWRCWYDEQEAWAFDPVVNTALAFKGPFRWDGLHKTERQLALRRESLRHGMNYGISNSARGADASISLLSFSGEAAIAVDPGAWERTAAALVLLTTMVHRSVDRLQQTDARRQSRSCVLRDAERRCLELIAGGKTAEAAAAVLGVRPRTVRYYLDRSAEKLGVESRKEAVMYAVANGIVDLRRFPPPGFSSEAESPLR